MKAPKLPSDESLRLKELRSYNILDTAQEKSFDEITSLAAKIAGAKIALVSLVDQDRQWFKSCFGMTEKETEREISFCGHAILGSEVFEVPDASADPAFSDNPLVTGPPFIRFYAGVPLITATGFRIGTLCVIHDSPKVLSALEREMLMTLARHVMALITLRKRSEELENLYDSLEQSVDAIMTVTPPEWKFRWANAATLQMFGVKSLEAFCELSPWDISPESQPDGKNSSEKAKAIIDAALEEGSKTFEWIHRRADGTFFPSVVRLSRIGEGPQRFLQAIIRDISEQKTLEAQLTEAQAISKVGSWSYNLHTGRQVWSLEHYKIFEIEPHQSDDVLFRLYREKIHPEDLPGLDEMIERAMSEGVGGVYNHRVILDNGARIKYVQGISQLFKDENGKPQYLSGTCRDRTKDVEEEERFRRLLEENRFILDSLGIGVWKVDLATGLQTQDRRSRELFGMTEVQNTNTHAEWLARLSQSSQDLIQTESQNILSGKDSFSITLEVNHAGKTRYIGSKGTVSKDSEGKPKVLYGINWDRSSELDLEKKLEEERILSLHSAKLASIGQLAAGVGHEINNPLAVIFGLILVIKQKLSVPGSEALILDKLEKMELSVDRIATIVKGLRTFSRSDSSELSDFDPFPMIKETVSFLCELYARESIEIVLQKERVPLIIRANRGRLQQVLVNLISNARDATAGKNLRRIEVSAMVSGTELVIKVRDNGFGIREEIRNRIFDPFFTTKALNEGTGIGLSLANTIIKEHGGRLDFTTVLGEGTEFQIIIPVVAGKSSEEKIPIAETAAMSALPTVLIVDDETELRDLLAELLRSHCRKVLTAPDGVSALKILQQESVDVVLSDIQMPLMDGFELISTIRKMFGVKAPDIYLITGGVEASVEIQASILGVKRVFFKPFKVKEILDEIGKIHPRNG